MAYGRKNSSGIVSEPAAPSAPRTQILAGLPSGVISTAQDALEKRHHNEYRAVLLKLPNRGHSDKTGPPPAKCPDCRKYTHGGLAALVIRSRCDGIDRSAATPTDSTPPLALFRISDARGFGNATCHYRSRSLGKGRWQIKPHHGLCVRHAAHMGGRFFLRLVE